MGARRITLDSDTRDFLEWRQGSGRTVEIYDIMVGSHRRQGRGRSLVNMLLGHHLPKGTTLVYAITRIDNIIAKQFYEELRFRLIGSLWNFYKDTGAANTVDAVMYGRDVPLEG
jgi:ribosomal protein S18 acetylase RimI-like enzyme